jgi:hypothetical protein
MAKKAIKTANNQPVANCDQSSNFEVANCDLKDSSEQGEIVLYQPDETIRLEVRMGDDTVWLTQVQMAELFDKDRTVIGRHIRNIYQEEELEKNITCAKFAHMGTDGDQVYEYTAYNLDVIISVGYRVKSKRGTKFRQWANKVLKEYLLRGYAMNSRLLSLEQHLAQHDKEISHQFQLDINRHNTQYPAITVEHFNRAHDRFLLIDDEVYHIGASIKDLGKKWFAFTLMKDITTTELINKITAE